MAYPWFRLQIIANISDVIIKTLMSCESEVSSYCTRVFHQRNLDPAAGSACFELFGFDILLDRDLRAWLIEVNICPSLSSSSPLDRNIKHTLMCDIFHMVGFAPYDPRTVDQDMMQSKVDRMMSKSRERGTDRCTHVHGVGRCTCEDALVFLLPRVVVVVVVVCVCGGGHVLISGSSQMRGGLVPFLQYVAHSPRPFLLLQPRVPRTAT